MVHRTVTVFAGEWGQVSYFTRGMSLSSSHQGLRQASTRSPGRRRPSSQAVRRASATRSRSFSAAPEITARVTNDSTGPNRPATAVIGRKPSTALVGE